MGAAARCAFCTASVPPTAPRPAARDRSLLGAIPSFRLAHEADRHVGIAPGAAARSGFRLGAAVGALGVERAVLDCVLPVAALGCRPLPASGNGEQAQLGKTSAKGEAKQRGANLPTASVRPFLRSRLLSGDGSVDVVKHELLSHRVEGTEILYCCCPGGGGSRRGAGRRRAQRGRLRR